MTTRALILARGRGSRMRQPDAAARLTPEQQRAADAGLKAMMPIGGRPFLDHLIASLADAGIVELALVVAPDHEAMRRYYRTEQPPRRVRLDFVVQAEPAGTANAILSAEPWTRGAPFLAMNSDNLYPVEVLRELAALDSPGLPVFTREELVRTSNIPGERVRAFALIEIDRDGWLRQIVEKPSAAEAAAAGPLALVSMNCWRFDARIFEPCRDVKRSARGEFELPEAVALAVARGVPFRAFRAAGPVLDLSRRGDAAELERRLAGVTPQP